MYPAATMETATATTEQAFYANLGVTSVNTPTGYPVISGNAKVAQVNGSGQKIGPAIVLKVMATDTFHLTATSWWKSTNTPGTPANPLNDLVSLLNAQVGSVPGGHADPTALGTSGAFTSSATDFLNSQSFNSGKPKAFINWICFDEQFKYVNSGSGFEQVGGSDVLTTHAHNNLTVQKNGFL